VGRTGCASWKTPGAAPLLQPTKGVHVLVDRSRLDHREAIAFTSPIDGRVMFVLPWGNLSYIGTTDTDSSEPPDELSISADDIIYLLRSTNARFPSARLSIEDVRAAWAGLRPLWRTAIGGWRRAAPEHAIVQGSGGMLTVVGGKLTTYRSMSAEVVDQAMRELRHAMDDPATPRLGRTRIRSPAERRPTSASSGSVGSSWGSRQ